MQPEAVAQLRRTLGWAVLGFGAGLLSLCWANALTGGVALGAGLHVVVRLVTEHPDEPSAAFRVSVIGMAVAGMVLGAVCLFV